MNTKSKNYKKYLELRKAIYKNWETQKNLGYKPLENPIHHGFDAYFVLRDDISRRNDANIFQYIIDNFSNTVWNRRNDLRVYSYKSKSYTLNIPTIKEIPEHVYENLNNNVKKYFYGYEKCFWNSIRKVYVCTVPSHFFTVKVVKSYKTHYKVIDEVLLQEESYLRDKLYQDHYNEWSYSGSAPKKYIKLCNRKDRRKTNIEIRKAFIKNEWDEMELPLNHRHYGKWEYY